MCWIAFAKGNELHRVLGRQRERWLDWIWISMEWLYWFRWFHPIRNDQWHFISEQVRFDWYITYIKELIEQEKAEDNFCLFHHRKWSVWSISLENCHPVTNKKFSVMQNWTERLLRQWWDVEWIDSSKSDTFCLATFLSLKANNLMEIIDLLDWFSDKLLDVWVLLIADVKTWEILFYSDGKRESYISFWKKPKTIDMIESWHWIDRSICHKNNWWMIFNFKWKIKDMSIKDPNESYKNKTVLWSYTDDNWETKYRPSYYETEKNLDKSKDVDDNYWKDCRVHRYPVTKKETKDEDKMSIFMCNIKRSINKWDVRLEEINEIPEWLLDLLSSKNQLRKFRRTYEQAIKRAQKFDTTNDKKTEEFRKIFWANKETEWTSILEEITKDKEVQEILWKLDEKLDESNKDIPPEDIADSSDKSIMNVNWYKFSEFLQCIDWINDVASEDELDFYNRYHTKITDISLKDNKVTLEKKHYFQTNIRKVDLLIDRSDNCYSVINELDWDTPLKIKVDWTLLCPILCPEY